MYYRGSRFFYDELSVGQYKMNKNEFSSGNNTFAFGLFKQLCSHSDHNVLISPVAITAAMMTVSAGARGPTASKIKQTLRLGSTIYDNSVHTMLRDILQSLPSGHLNGHNLLAANRLFLQDELVPLSEFVDLLQHYYDTSVASTRFSSNNPESLRIAINHWMEIQTQGFVKDILGPGDINELSRCVLINGVYFKGLLERGFDPSENRAGWFFPTPSSKVMVDMMHKKGHFKFGVDGRLQCRVLEMPLAGSRFNLCFILPKEVSGLPALENRLNPDSLRMLMSGLYEYKVTVSIPRFTVSSTQSLNGPLSTMGLGELFEANKANLTGIAGADELSDGLCLSQLAHKAVFTFNEQGATTLNDDPHGHYSTLPQVEDYFIADHPFLFFLKDSQSDLFLLLGRMKSPE